MRPFRVLAFSALLGGTFLGGAALASSTDAKSDATLQAKAAALSQGIEDGLRDAKAKRAAGDLNAAVMVLSQLMLINADDGRVVAEYGKVLVQQGRAREALDFLNRAVQLTQTDWTLYSALGVAYDGNNDFANARAAYDHALRLKPGEPAILNNYALSRAMAGDLAGAKALIAQAAATSKDERVARNVKMINGLTPLAASKIASTPKALPVPPPVPMKAASKAPAKTHSDVASGPPRTLTTAEGKQIVMQAVPVDALAGAVGKAHKTASKNPAPIKTAKQSDGIPALRLANDRQ
ncbi:MAG: tetratricopeptide repeat protein [Rhizomicrobium sp.]|nr:tetratricopeptide repeat protein [Rhizomicrobium sp.]